MSFYITIELELFPGTSPNMFQKSVIRCQSTFERIREAYADLFGYQYRPAAMSDAYTYSIKKDDKKNDKKNNKKDDKKNNKKVGGRKSQKNRKRNTNKTCKIYKKK